MEDRRRDNRTEYNSKLVVKRIDDNIDEEVAIGITDVSKSGIGFECDKLLDIGSTYDAYLTIWTKEIIHAFIQIVRIELKQNGYGYGGVFVGMPQMDAARIETYQTVSENL